MGKIHLMISEAIENNNGKLKKKKKQTGKVTQFWNKKEKNKLNL